MIYFPILLTLLPVTSLSPHLSNRFRCPLHVCIMSTTQIQTAHNNPVQMLGVRDSALAHYPCESPTKNHELTQICGKLNKSGLSHHSHGFG